MSTAEVIQLDYETKRMSNIKQGHIVLHRSVNNADWASDAVSFTLWAKLLCMASYKDRNHSFDGKSWELKTGQLVSTYAILGKMVKVNGIDTDKATVRRIINLFCEKGMLSKVRQGNSIVITITNYAQYQSDFFDTPKVTPENTPNDTLKTSKEKASDGEQITPENTLCDTPKVTQNNTLLNNTLNNNKKHMSSGDDQPTSKSKNVIDCDLVMDAYNDAVQDRLPAVKKITPARKNAIKKLLKEFEEPTFQALANYFYDFVDNATPFYFGENDRNWKADFDYIIKPKTYIKVVEKTL